MSALSNLNTDIKRFWNLPHHDNPELAEKLEQVQSWQRKRMLSTHSDLFTQPKNKAMADYFLYRLYGGADFEAMIRQLERIVPKAQKVERLAPAAALETGTTTIQAAITATELDLHLAQWLLENGLDVNEANMLKAYQNVDEADERRAQIQSLNDVCYRIDKYVNSFMLQKAFKFTKNTAYKRNFKELYDFIAEGFAAMKPLKSVAAFLEPFCEREFAVIDHVHSSKNDGSIEPSTY